MRVTAHPLYVMPARSKVGWPGGIAPSGSHRSLRNGLSPYTAPVTRPIRIRHPGRVSEQPGYWSQRGLAVRHAVQRRGRAQERIALRPESVDVIPLPEAIRVELTIYDAQVLPDSQDFIATEPTPRKFLR